MIKHLKNLLLLIAVMTFTVSTASAHVGRTILPFAKQQPVAVPTGKATAIRLPSNGNGNFTTIYARVEVTNVSGIVYGPSTDQYDEAAATFTIRFYSNQACTIPYSLTADLTVHVLWRTETAYSDYGPSYWDDHFTYTGLTGNNYASIGSTQSLHIYHDWFDGVTWHYEHNEQYYDVEDPGDGSYIPETTVGR